MNFSIKELNELIYSLGTTASKGMLVDRELNSSLLDKLYAELNRKLQVQSDYDDVMKNIQHIHIEEDLFAKVLKSEEQPKKSNGWITQAILDYVDEMGSATYTEMNEFYRAITLGSNSFSHHLYNLTIPYKNRLTRRYLHKIPGGSYVVKVAGLHNWIEKDY